MMPLHDKRSIVAVDPTPYGLTYAFFEDGQLMDWATFRRNGEGDERAILDRILGGTAADVVVLEDPRAPGAKRYARVRILLQALATHARKRGLEVRLVARQDVRDSWKAHGIANKQAVAAAIAARLPELRAFVPPDRKNTMREDDRVHIFDAVSLALYAFGEPRDGFAR
jgi:hypothetical protein